MNGTLIVALYATIVATAGVSWQVFLWRAEHAGRLSATVTAAWMLDEESIRVSITNLNTYDIPLRGAKIFVKGEHSGFTVPVELDYLGYAKEIKARSNVEWKVDREYLARYGYSLFKMSEVHVGIVTGVGRSVKSSAKVEDLDKWDRETTTSVMGKFSEISSGDLVRVRSTSERTMGADEGRTGTILGYNGLDPAFQVWFEDHSNAFVPVANLELVTTYSDRLKERYEGLREGVPQSSTSS